MGREADVTEQGIAFVLGRRAGGPVVPTIDEEKSHF